jgi:hypothetical protein
MPMTQSAVRAAVRATNAVGSALSRAGVRTIGLEERPILDAARRATQLEDFGDETFREPLRVLLRAIDDEARLTLLGRIVARQDIVGLLANRLRLQDDRKRNSAIGAEEIRRPLFIVGLPRTGSTLLHHLLAQDPSSRVAQAWEVMYPSPPPTRETYETDARIARAARHLKWLDTLTPDFKAIHAVGAQLALECIAFMSPSFICWRFNTMYRVPSYQDWLEGQDFLPTYAFHRRFLQQLQWRAPGGRWVLKAPSHMLAFDALFETYPDAQIVQTHRDPLTVLASAASLTAVLHGAFSDQPDPVDIGNEVRRRWTLGIERGMQFRRSGRVPEDRFLDVHYHDLVVDPMGAVRRIYEHCGMSLTDAAEARMRKFLADNPQGRHGRHRYSLEAFGLDFDDLFCRFKAYRENFGIPSEPLAA